MTANLAVNIGPAQPPQQLAAQQPQAANNAQPQAVQAQGPQQQQQPQVAQQQAVSAARGSSIGPANANGAANLIQQPQLPSVREAEMFVREEEEPLPEEPAYIIPDYLSRRSCLATLASCIWGIFRALFSCICCCFMERAPRRRRRNMARRPNPQNQQNLSRRSGNALRQQIRQNAPQQPILTDRQKVERVLAIPADGVRDKRTEFFAVFKALPENVQNRVKTKVYEVDYIEVSRLMLGARDEEKSYFPEVTLRLSRDQAIERFIQLDFFNETARAELRKVLAEMMQPLPVEVNVQAQPAADLPPAVPEQPLQLQVQLPVENQQPIAPLQNAADVPPAVQNQPPAVQVNAELPPAIPEQTPQLQAQLPAQNQPAIIPNGIQAANLFLQIDPKVMRQRAVTFVETNVMAKNLFQQFEALSKEVRTIIRDAVMQAYPREIAALKSRMEFDRRLSQYVFPFQEDKAAIDEFMRTRLQVNDKRESLQEKIAVRDKILEALKKETP